MELVQGRQLTTLIADGPDPVTPGRGDRAGASRASSNKAHRFDTDIEGQRYALIVHADLKPDHVLLLGDGGIRVLDFGIAKALAARTLVTTNKWGSRAVRLARAAAVRRTGQRARRLLVARRHAVRDAGRLPAVPAVRAQPEPARQRHPATGRPRAAAAPHRTGARRHRPQAAGAATRTAVPAADAIVRDLDAFLQWRTHCRRARARAGEPGNACDSRPRVEVTCHAAAPGAAGQRRLADRRPYRPSPSPRPGGARGHRVASPSQRRRRRKRLRRPGRRAARVLLAAAGLATVASEGSAFIRASGCVARFRRSTSPTSTECAPSTGASTRWTVARSWTRASCRHAHGAHAGARRSHDRRVSRRRRPTVARAQWEQAHLALDFAMRASLRRIRPSWESARTFGGSWPGHRVERTDGYRGHPTVPRSGSPGSAIVRSVPRPGQMCTRTHARSRRADQGDRRSTEPRVQTGTPRARAGRRSAHDAGRRSPREAARLKGAEQDRAARTCGHRLPKCIEYFDGLRLFNSEANLRTCRKRLAEVTRSFRLPLTCRPRPRPKAAAFGRRRLPCVVVQAAPSTRWALPAPTATGGPRASNVWRLSSPRSCSLFGLCARLRRPGAPTSTECAWSRRPCINLSTARDQAAAGAAAHACSGAGGAHRRRTALSPTLVSGPNAEPLTRVGQLAGITMPATQVRAPGARAAQRAAARTTDAD